MKLEDLCVAFHGLRLPGLGERAHPDRASILEARSRVTDAVVDDEFLADCISWELRLIEAGHPRRGLVPFFTIPELGVRFAFGYWAPGATTGPHEHTAWTITAVCRNELEVVTYDRHASYRQRHLVPKHRFQASAGRVGFIYEPCIHSPINTTDDWSLSLHVTSPRDGERLLDYEESLPELTSRWPAFSAAIAEHPYTRVLLARQQRRHAHVLASILATMNVSHVPRLLEKCSEFGSSATRRLVASTARSPIQGDDSESQWLIRRTHEDLVLGYRHHGDSIVLEVESPDGPRQDLVVNDVARDVIAFVARESIFEARALPGPLSHEENMALIETLEEIGILTMVRK